MSTKSKLFAIHIGMVDHFMSMVNHIFIHKYFTEHLRSIKSMIGAQNILQRRLCYQYYYNVTLYKAFDNDILDC